MATKVSNKNTDTERFIKSEEEFICEICGNNANFIFNNKDVCVNCYVDILMQEYITEED